MLSKALDSLFARVYDPMMAHMEERGLSDQRAQLLGGLNGDVLEIGAGTGLNLPAYPDTLRSLTLTEPIPQMGARLRTRVAAQRPGTTIVEAGAEQLPFDDDSFDAVVTTLVLCTVRDLPQSLAEVKRVLRPDGRLVVLEHVRAEGRVGQVQNVLAPVQRVMGRGCHLNRDIRAALAEAGFDVGGIVPGEMPGAAPTIRQIISGVATPD